MRVQIYEKEVETAVQSLSNQTKQGDMIMIKNLCKTNKRLIFNQRGQGLVEYALILVLIAVAIMAAVSTLKNSISGTYSKVGSSIQ